MNVTDQIKEYIGSQPQSKRVDMDSLHKFILQILPDTILRFDDGKNSEGKIVTNPTVGYGNYTIKYANGTTRDFFQIGISANTTGISIYILGIADKTYLSQTYGNQLGKASVTGYCIKFRKLQDINLSTLEAAIRDGVKISSEN